MNAQAQISAETAVNIPVLESRGLVLTYRKNTVLDGIDLQVAATETLAVLAAGGTGKSALFRLLIDLEPPTAGAVFWFGRAVAQLRERDKQQLRRQIGVVHQNGALFADLTVAENVALPLVELTDHEHDQIESTVRQTLTWVGLDRFKDLYPSALSALMIRRTALARALVLGPRLLVCDDIFAGLDPGAQQQIDRYLRALHILQGRATIILTHNVNMAVRLADRIVVLADARIVADGPAAAIRHSDLPEIRALLHDES
jgi:phospholipid/cholesterol/gamma-HCH transport system ATP-binding protein